MWSSSSFLLQKAYAQRTEVEKEHLAIKLDIEAFHVYPLGRKLMVQTDHQALQWLTNLRNHNHKLMRWNRCCNHFTFKVQHRKGTNKANTDILSQIPYWEAIQTGHSEAKGGRSVTGQKKPTERWSKWRNEPVDCLFLSTLLIVMKGLVEKELIPSNQCCQGTIVRKIFGQLWKVATLLIYYTVWSYKFWQLNCDWIHPAEK